MLRLHGSKSLSTTKAKLLLLRKSTAPFPHISLQFYLSSFATVHIYRVCPACPLPGVCNE